jgi:hypothetical protein
MVPTFKSKTLITDLYSMNNPDSREILLFYHPIYYADNPNGIETSAFGKGFNIQNAKKITRQGIAKAKSLRIVAGISFRFPTQITGFSCLVGSGTDRPEGRDSPRST